MKRFRRNASTLLLAASLSATVVAAKTAAESTPPSVPVVPLGMSYEEKKLRELDAPGIANLWFYPRVSGSTSTIPVGQALLARAMGLDGELRRATGRGLVDLSGEAMTSSLTITFPLDADAGQLEKYSALLARNRHLQTHESYTALAGGGTDLIFVAREPSPDELQTAAQNNMQFDVRPVALDALVFIANTKNPVSGLTLEQIRGVYTGEIQNWETLKGEKEAITAITRDRNSGSEELMRKLVMGDRKTIPGRSREVLSMIGTLDAVVNDKDALAYSVYYYERVMNPRAAIKPLAVNGVLPTPQSIASKTYPLVEPVYVVTRKDIDAKSPTTILRDWLLSKAGQQFIAQTGYVPFSK